MQLRTRFEKKTIEDLPDELLIIIISFLPTFDWNLLKRVNKKWYNILNTRLVKKNFRKKQLTESSIKTIYCKNYSRYYDRLLISFDPFSNSFAVYSRNNLQINLYREFTSTKRGKSSIFYVTFPISGMRLIRNSICCYAYYLKRLLIFNTDGEPLKTIPYKIKDITKIIITNNANFIYEQEYKVSYFHKRKSIDFREIIIHGDTASGDKYYVLTEDGMVSLLDTGRTKKFRVFKDSDECNQGYIAANDLNDNFLVCNDKIIKIFNSYGDLLNKIDMILYYGTFIFNNRITIFAEGILYILDSRGKLIKKKCIKNSDFLIKGPYNSTILCRKGYTRLDIKLII